MEALSVLTLLASLVATVVAIGEEVEPNAHMSIVTVSKVRCSPFTWNHG